MKILKLLLVAFSGNSIINANLFSENSNDSKTSLKANNDSTLNDLTSWYENTSSEKTNELKNYIDSHTQVKINSSAHSSDKYTVTNNFSKNDLDNFLKDGVITDKIETILESDNYSSSLGKLAGISNIITISDNGNGTNSIIYNGDTDKDLNSDESNSNYKAWTIAHWYWFGYWKLCFNSPLCQKIEGMLLKDPDQIHFTQALTPYIDDCSPSGFAKGIAGFLIANAVILHDNDHGNGVWIGILLIIPDMGWGSLGGNKSIKPAHEYNRLFWDDCGGWGYSKDVTHTYNILDYTDYGNFKNYVKEHPQFDIPDYTYAVYNVNDDMNEKHMYTNWTDWSSIKFNDSQLIGSYTVTFGLLAKYWNELHLTWLDNKNQIQMQYHFEANNSDCFSDSATWVSYTKINFAYEFK